MNIQVKCPSCGNYDLGCDEPWAYASSTDVDETLVRAVSCSSCGATIQITVEETHG